MTHQSDAKHDVTLEINGDSQDTIAKKSTKKTMQRQALQDEIVSTLSSQKEISTSTTYE
jgi:hypothetical protein